MPRNPTLRHPAARRRHARRPAAPIARRGYSIIELLIVLTIIGITTAIALPKLRGMGLGTDIVSAQNALVSRVAGTRAAAIQAGQSSRIYFHRDSVWTVTVSGTGVETRVGSMLNLRGQFNVTAVVNPADNTFIQFDPRGIGSLAGGAGTMVRLELTRDAQHTGRFCVTRYGRVIRGAQLAALCPAT